MCALGTESARASASAPRVSVVVPTYHRPERLAECVRGVLAQRLRRYDFEVLICVSDPTHAPDRNAAEALAAADERVHLAEAQLPGPGAARNAGIQLARGDLLAFIDDDCVPEPGWLQAGVAALADVDVVQGHTVPADKVVPFAYHTVGVARLSFHWESCNLFVRRSAIERAGPFNELWNPTGQVGQHWGEDVEWGWRLVRNGASYAYADGARVVHMVTPRSIHAYVTWTLRTRYIPMQVCHSPELRRRYFGGYFLTTRHAVITASAMLLTVAAGARLAGERRASRVALGIGVGGLLQPLWTELMLHGRVIARSVGRQLLHDSVEFAGCAYGSIRYRRVVL